VPAYADLVEGKPDWSGMLDSGLQRLELAPRGLDAAMLWAASLAGPGLAEHLYRLGQVDLDSRDGQLIQLFFAAGIVGAPVDDVKPLLNAAHTAVKQLLIPCGRDHPNVGDSSGEPPRLLQAPASGSRATYADERLRSTGSPRLNGYRSSLESIQVAQLPISAETTDDWRRG
jgi:hypothetical protein